MAKTWTLEEIMNLPTVREDDEVRRKQSLAELIQAGDIIPASTWEDLGGYGFGGTSGWAAPNTKAGGLTKQSVFDFAKERGLTPQQYQAQYGALPFVFNADGTATYDPTAQKNTYGFQKDRSGFEKFLDAGGLPFSVMAGMGGLIGSHALATAANTAGGGTAGGVGGTGSGGLTPGNMQWLNNSVAGPIPEGMNIAGATGAPTTAAGEFSLAQPGMGYGGVGSGGTGLALTPGNTIAQTAGGLAQAGGVSLPAYTGAGAGMGAGLGLQIPTGPSLTVPTQKSWMEKAWDTIIGKPIGIMPGEWDWEKDLEKNTEMPAWMTSGLALADYLAKRGQAGDIRSDAQRAAEMADPFADQRKFYQERLRQSYLDPNFWDTDPGWAGIRNSSTNSTLAALAAKGYSQSPGKMMYEIGKRLQDEQMKYALGWQGQMGQFAGAGVSPATAGQLYQSGANLASQERNKEYDALGTLAASIPNTIKQLQLLT